MDKLPPQNIEAEKSVLGAILLEKEAIVTVADVLGPSDFYRDDHGLIFETMQELFEDRQPIDLVTLTNALEGKGKLSQVGGATYLSSLLSGVSSAAHIKSHAEIVVQKALLRRLITVSTQAIEGAYSEAEDAAALLDKTESNLFAVSQRYLPQNFIELKSVLASAFDRIDELHKHRGAIRGLPTGFRDLDNLLAGLQKSDLVIVAARPSMGKTSLALNIAAHAACKDKTPVGIFSLEMSRDQLVDRILTMQANIDSWRLRTGNLTDDDFSRLNFAMGDLSEAPLFIDDSPLLTPLEIRSKARRLQAEHGLGLVVVDYLQLMDSTRGRTSSELNRVQEVSEISRGLKALARELNVPVLACSQLSRAVEQRPGPKIPQLSDLRESGSIEQDADVVMFIYREEYYHPDTEEKGIAKILIRKHRNGPTGEVDLYFQPEHSRFANLEKQREEAKLEPVEIEE